MNKPVAGQSSGMPDTTAQPTEVLAGSIERVTFHSAESGFCVLRIKARGHRQVPVFDVPDGNLGYLPEGPPPAGLPVARLRGLASRDGLARALARRFQSAGRTDWPISASATGSA